MKRSEDLQELLRRIDHRGYPAYKDTAGAYEFPAYVLSIDHVQGDPFAAPSKLSIHIKGKTAGFPKDLWKEEAGRLALEDLILRGFGRELAKYAFQAKGSGKSGLLSVSRPGQEVLDRTACQLDGQTGDLVVRFEVGFPANGRTINAGELQKILFRFLPDCVRASLYYKSLDAKKVRSAVDLAEDQTEIRRQLKDQGLAAFVANGSVLPRESGISDLPMKKAVVFQSPKSLEITLDLPHAGRLSGMGIKNGVTLIVGGGYHGKSTLLKALERGIYNHIRGDGREYVITDDTAVKIRAEDGRSICRTDISMFINGLPNGKDTVSFSTADASGSTSQAANVVEAIEAGARLLLIDEDTSATNFMIRDELMARVVHADMEPITPFLDRVDTLYKENGLSTILVAGSCGTYFQKADCVIQMLQYQPLDITQKAWEETEKFLGKDLEERPVKPFRQPDFSSRTFENGKRAGAGDRTKIKSMGRDAVSIDKNTVELRYVEQLADSEQVLALGYLLKYAQQHLVDGKRSLQTLVGLLQDKVRKEGIGSVCQSRYVPGNLALPRIQEIYACFNRCRMWK